MLCYNLKFISTFVQKKMNRSETKEPKNAFQIQYFRYTINSLLIDQNMQDTVLFSSISQESLDLTFHANVFFPRLLLDAFTSQRW